MYLCEILLVCVILQQTSTSPISSVGGSGGGDGEEEERDMDIFEINKDLNLHEGDIKLMPVRSRNIILGDWYKWELPVPYVLSKTLDLNAKGVVLKALDQIRLKTCVDFKPREAERNYIEVIKSIGCWSYVGNQRQGNQSLSIGNGCGYLGIVEHEFLHALGFWHEQSRYDRDDYVTIVWENIRKGQEHNFKKQSSNTITTFGIEYDYTSVMHYGENSFSNGNGSTIITRLPEYQDVIGQRLEMSSNDVLKLQKQYGCTSAVAFLESCSFEGEGMCDMTLCGTRNISWEKVNSTKTGPFSDHSGMSPQGHFMHASTASGQEGDSAWLEMHIMSPNRDCHIQCLQFYYYHSGDESDQLNIWIREFEDDNDVKGTRRLMGQITGPQTSHWQFKHVSLNATRHFQVEFEARKGAGNSSGGFSIDDINLSEIECPHVTLQIDDFEKLLNTSKFGTPIQTPRQYSTGGYAYSVGTVLNKTRFGVFVQLLSGKYDDNLTWPCTQRQVTFQILDQNPNIQLQMSKQRSIITDGSSIWGNPSETGDVFGVENNETIYGGPLRGFGVFMTLEEVKTREFLKGGSAVFAFSFQDLTPLVNGSVLPCPEVGPVNVTHQPTDADKGPCSPRIPPPKPTDGSVFGFSPGLVACPVLTLLFASMLLMP